MIIKLECKPEESVLSAIESVCDKISERNLSGLITTIELTKHQWIKLRVAWNKETFYPCNIGHDASWTLYRGVTIKNGDAKDWTCPHCNAGIASLSFAKDVTLYSRVDKIENGKAFMKDKWDLELEGAINHRLWCTECDHYFYEYDSPTREIEIEI